MFEPGSRGRILTADRRGPMAYRACTSTSGVMCTDSPPPCARRRFRKSLSALRLHHGRPNGDAVPDGAAVAGATPLFRCLVWHRGGWDVHFHPNLPRGSLPVHRSLQEGQRRAVNGFSVRLGTIPDYSRESGGMGITGVRDGSPAATAGIKGGDIIVKFGPPRRGGRVRLHVCAAQIRARRRGRDRGASGRRAAGVHGGAGGGWLRVTPERRRPIPIQSGSGSASGS